MTTNNFEDKWSIPRLALIAVLCIASVFLAARIAHGETRKVVLPTIKLVPTTTINSIEICPHGYDLYQWVETEVDLFDKNGKSIGTDRFGLYKKIVLAGHMYNQNTLLYSDDPPDICKPEKTVGH